ncbi:caspase recruitment domain-containing protein 10-like isoform X1 [Gadus macrocephalus]|uniref:caspase recruitment domain-containing protein 10-like isoform X1 n=1 Tax=Gadus macrocephalus TaxID=80720 RepID=UPI0028CB69AE|nr:caspase recruitment domain-containing protein 10-like isoform X1 [Gadus macrocephalus]
MLRCPSQGPAAAAAATQNHGLGAEEIQEEGALQEGGGPAGASGEGRGSGRRGPVHPGPLHAEPPPGGAADPLQPGAAGAGGGAAAGSLLPLAALQGAHRAAAAARHVPAAVQHLPSRTHPGHERCQKHVFMLNPSIPDDSLGIRLQSIQDIVSQDKHCLLELSLANVQGLLKQGVYPIVIHIQPKNKKYGRLKKWFPQCGEEKLIEDLCRREELQLETLPLFHHTLEPSRWSSTDDLLSAIRSAIDSQQRAVAWVEFERLQ